ncbi:hypothetical protein Ccrd_010603 [Cynara cardunculus var. scolymus]|uniref:Mediator of RNA polymerase II transcription subunit 9 n=1 Tax=Cynara cardunculus var. scolymus TaxID=59895 RepID=A0A103YKY4_CYNCS|nr:hypothetical protein Ccrd_010603 [Cynara cardunculus var. scolymus]
MNKKRMVNDKKAIRRTDASLGELDGARPGDEIRENREGNLGKLSNLNDMEGGALVENLADAIENGTRDQHFDTLVTELSSHFEKCQQLLNTISGSIATKAATVEGQKRKVEEAEQMLNQRRDLIAKYRYSVEELTKPDL